VVFVAKRMEVEGEGREQWEIVGFAEFREAQDFGSLVGSPSPHLLDVLGERRWERKRVEACAFPVSGVVGLCCLLPQGVPVDLGRGWKLEAVPETVRPALLGKWRCQELPKAVLTELEAGAPTSWPLLRQEARSLGLQVREPAVPCADSGREAAAAGARLPQAPGCRRREATDSGEVAAAGGRLPQARGCRRREAPGTWPSASRSTRLIASLAATRGAAASRSEVVTGDAEKYEGVALVLSCLLAVAVLIGMVVGVVLAVVVYNCTSHTRTTARLGSSTPRTNVSSSEMSTRGPGVREEGTEGGLRQRVR
jgi:hypothetical protein